MAGGFSIGAPTSTVVLDEARTGEASFTVKNETGHLVRARATIVALAPTDIGWLTIDGGPERDFPIDGIDQLVVVVQVPPSTPAGVYTFRLIVESTATPEERGESQVVAFQIPRGPIEPEVPVPDRPGYVETLLGALIGGIVPLVAGVVIAAIGRAVDADVVPIIGFLVGVIGSWLGPPSGAGIALRMGKFAEPSRTVLALVIFLVFLGLPIFGLLAAIEGNFGFDTNAAFELRNVGGLIVLVVDALVTWAACALAARAYARWREVGHL